ncbi:MAG: PilZ domain-containing protein [Tepidisphaeraceae bacterium]
MTSLKDRAKPTMKLTVESNGAERREHRRHDMEFQGIAVDRWDGTRRSAKQFGKLVDLSASGVRIRTEQVDVKPDNQIRVRLELPAFAGICPFIDASGQNLEPKREWVGWMAVARVNKVDGKTVDVAGRLVDMDEMDRGMLGLYLSTQPLAA